MDGVDLDVSQARIDLLPNKYDRRRISGVLAIRRLSSRHYKRQMSEGDVCSVWVLLLLLVCSLHHVIHSKQSRSFKRRHWLLVFFVSLPLGFCWKVIKKLLTVICKIMFKLLAIVCKIVKKLFKQLTAVCGTLAIGCKFYYLLWLFLKWCFLTAELCKQLDYNATRPSREVVGSKVTKKPNSHVSCEVFVYSGMGWVWSGSIQLRAAQLVLLQRLILSGDVELNPGPLDQDQKVEEVLMTVDDKTFDQKKDWNVVVIECKSLATRWKELSISLGLSYDVIDNIKGSGDNYHCWSEALNHWIKQNYDTDTFGRPSWRNLLKAVAEIDKLLFKTLAAKHSQSASSDEPKESNNSQEEDVAHVQDKPASPRTSIPTAVVVTPCFTFHCLNLKDMSDERRRELHQKLYADSEDMMYKFQELFTSTTDSLVKRNVSAKTLARHLECLGQLKPTFDDCGEPVFRHKLPELRKSESVDDAMSVVNKYCSFFNYRMVELIIQKLGTEQDKERLAKYKEDFAKYGERHVFECPSEVGEIYKEGQAKMFVTLDDSFDKCNVNHLSAFVRNLQKSLNISDITLQLCRIGPGSLKLIFQLSLIVQQTIFPLSSDQEAELVCLGVVQLSCGDYQFMPQQTEEVVEEPATDGDSDHTDSGATVDSKNTCDAELSSMAAELAVGKPGDTASISADSALGRSSVITGTTAGVTQFSEDLVDRELGDLGMGMGHGGADASTENELFQASGRGDFKKVKELIEENQFDPLQKEGQFGANILHYSAQFGQLGVLRYFVEERGCSPASQDDRASTPLHYAAYGKHLDIVHYLVAEQQMDPLCCDDDGTTPLHVASQGGDINVVRYLVNELSKFLPLKDIVTSRGIDGQAPVHRAALNGHLEIVTFFIADLKCDPNIATPVEYQGRTTGLGCRIALHHAAQRGHLHIIKYLVKQCNCNPSHLDSERVTPLHMAAQEGHLEVVQYLTLEQHCDPLCTNKNNNTPLHNAARRGHLQLVRFFVEVLHCPPDVRGWCNMTPLEQARRRGHHHVVQYLESIYPKLQ